MCRDVEVIQSPARRPDPHSVIDDAARTRGRGEEVEMLDIAELIKRSLSNPTL